MPSKATFREFRRSIKVPFPREGLPTTHPESSHPLQRAAQAIIAPTHGPTLWHKTRALRNSVPTHLSANPEFKQPFEREARTVSSLNHPHICHLYDERGGVRCSFNLLLLPNRPRTAPN